MGSIQIVLLDGEMN